ncbi:uncharacterized protein LOC128872882 isoform X1 [Hylaeus volcanicus]|uniref:uncharacterized protein LOC128872882 isoform X1 n=1 Tax=Hylaeus volcanicus TaxID=313075 RepID=UPI0023B84BA4|nr:uncharacterized protein LOC128872882 isoform X1 [Hylaeus volcanicus]XP_053971991.1 uncharacterized protein LOC128872882 isoform X1 [Hylaeus volcanicus]
MGFDRELADILRDVVQFLEWLREVKLPVNLESIRDSLLMRSKDTMTMLMVERMVERPSSPDPNQYLNMNAAGPKGLVATTNTEPELEEYVPAEQHQPQNQPQHDYYETFEPIESTNATTDLFRLSSKHQQIETTLMDIYSNFSAAQAKNQCLMCGPLYRKEGKKLFVFEQYRACWVGLLGLHLLIYGNDHDNRPWMILPIRGYMARAAPNAIPRDQRKSESTFEIFCPGNKTFQFIARTPNDMEQWVAKISESSQGERNENKEFTNSLVASTPAETNTSQSEERFEKLPRQHSNSNEERYQDVESLGIDKLPINNPSIVSSVTNQHGQASSSKDALVQVANSSILSTPAPAPPLPARIPRRLPSLPVRASSSTYRLPDEEEDDIYHKIEDFRDTGHCYGNVGNVPEIRLATYDDVFASKDESKSEEKPKKAKKKKHLESATRRSNRLENEATYDDAAPAATASKDTLAHARLDQRDQSESYDDIENFLPNATSSNIRPTEVTEEPTKSPVKKSFLDKVRKKKESPRKNDKKQKRQITTPPPSANIQQLPTYDDISDLMNNQKAKRNFEDESEYTSPPPPRPVCAKPPPLTVDAADNQEFYDDVVTCRGNYTNEETCQSDQRIPKQLNHVRRSVRPEIDNFVSRENIDNPRQSLQDNQHYQTPRTESSHRKYPLVDQQEQLYDDIAILADFTARQKECLGKKDNQDATNTQISFEKRSWNRFVNGKKSKIPDPMGFDRNSRISSGTEDSDDRNDHHGVMRMNTFQKLISKMENSLGKSSVKTTSSVILNKTNVTNNA